MTELRSRYAETEAFITKDGSTIRELMHPQVHGNRNQSLAEAIVPPHGSTALHRHHQSEEIYYFLAGHGRMVLGDEEFAVGPGDTVCIAPGTAHCLHNESDEELRLLCSCSPPYRDDDTEML